MPRTPLVALLLVAALVGCSAPTDTQRARALDLVKPMARPTEGEGCVTVNGARDKCVVVETSIAHLVDDKPEWCGHWFGYSAQNETFGCLAGNATRHGESVMLRLVFLYPDRNATTPMERLFYVFPPAEGDVPVTWEPAQG